MRMLEGVKSKIRTVMRRAVLPTVQERLLPMDHRIHQNSFVVGKLYPLNTHTANYVNPLLKPQGSHTLQSLPVPGKDYWEGYAENEQDYLACGQKDVSVMLGILEQAGQTPQTLTKVLDLGCAAARMLRHYPVEKGISELWGCDINARHINWCQQHLSDPFRFFTNSTSPHLPFEDNSFDLVYCGSVFTHITDIADNWFLEIIRILRKGGYAYITIHDEQTLALLFTKYKDDPLFTSVLKPVEEFYNGYVAGKEPYAYFTIDADPVSQVFYNRNYLLQKWGRFADHLSTHPEAHDHQTALLFRKP